MFERVFLGGMFVAKVIFVIENTKDSFDLLLQMYPYQLVKQFCLFNAT